MNCMTKIEQLLLHCDDRMQHTNCEKCEYEGGCLRRLRSDCYECLSKIHKVYNHDLHYSCDKILYNYVLKHQIRYASEIAWGYNIISRIRKEFSPSPVIYSIGCGPASELYAIDEYSRRTGQFNNYYYKGFDLLNKWDVINDYSLNLFGNDRISFLYEDMFNYINNCGEIVDVLIANYFFSDLMRYDKQRANNVIDSICELYINKKILTILVNDIPLFYENGDVRASAYPCMQLLEKRLGHLAVQSVVKVRFSDPKYDSIIKYGRKLKNNKCCFSIPTQVDKYEPFNVCNSIMMIISQV